MINNAEKGTEATRRSRIQKLNDLAYYCTNERSVFTCTDSFATNLLPSNDFFEDPIDAKLVP